MISVVCTYNDKETLDKYLLKSLKTQTVKYELILINNTKNQFKSASEALNSGGNRANGKYIMFVHQDVDLMSNAWLEKSEEELDKLPNIGVAGVAGMAENANGIISNIIHGEPPEPAGGIQIKYPTMVQTVDECLFIIPKSVFNILKFDNNLNDRWHLYAVDYSLCSREMGYNIFVLPFSVYHSSKTVMEKNKFMVLMNLGYLPKTYFPPLKRLLKKHNGHFRKVHTTCGVWNTTFPILLQRYLYFVKESIKWLFGI